MILPSGKQARATNANEDSSRSKHDASPPQAPQPVQHKNMPASEPGYGQHHQPREPVEAFSEAPGDGQNRAAQAGNIVAHHAEPAQQVKSSKSKRVDEANLAKLIAEENASKSKFPRYPGLERWELVEKMGDGAFSNVYRARDTTGESGEVAIKVVRKYEMNSMQVSSLRVVLSALPVSFLAFHIISHPFLCPLNQQWGGPPF